MPFFAYPPEVRRIIYTTNAIESLNSKLRTTVRSRGHFPNDEAATKLLFLVLREVSRECAPLPPIRGLLSPALRSRPRGEPAAVPELWIRLPRDRFFCP